MNSPLPFVARGAKTRGMVAVTHPVIHSFVADDIIITCVRWYLRFKLSYRDLATRSRLPSPAR
jgi:transposase-like protein